MHSLEIICVMNTRYLLASFFFVLLVIERIDKEKERKKNEEKRKTSLNFLIAIYFQKFEIFEKKEHIG